MGHLEVIQDLQLASAGALLRDHAWFIKSAYFCFQQQETNKRAEGMEVIKGIDLAQHLGIRGLIIEGHYEIPINMSKGKP
jgi:hypothetical protein